MSLKNSKKELIRSAVSLSLCGALFVGGTLAYFTKTVYSQGNVISTKTLNIDVVDSSGNSITEGTELFNEKIIPGEWVTKKIVVKNTGELEFTYTISLIKGDIEGDEALQEVIEVYVDGKKVGSLSDVLNGSAVEKRTLGSNLNREHTIELLMPHRDGGYDADTYSGKTVGNFTVQVVANEILSNN